MVLAKLLGSSFQATSFSVFYQLAGMGAFDPLVLELNVGLYFNTQRGGVGCTGVGVRSSGLMVKKLNPAS